MAPPELPADAPIPDFVHPIVIDPGPGLGHETYAAFLNRADGGRRQRLDVDEPLIGQQRLENRVAAIAARYGEFVRFDAFDEAQGVQIGENFFSGGKAIQTLVGTRDAVVQRGVQGHDVDHGQVVPLPQFVVIEVVSRRDLDAAAAESWVHVRICNDG
jgi:hypothetical protein